MPQSAAADHEKGESPVALFLKPAGRAENDVQARSHTYGPYVNRDKFSIQPEFASEVGATRCGLEFSKVDAVGDDRYAGGVDAFGNEVFAIAFSHGDDVIGGAVESFFEPLKKTKDPWVSYGPDRGDRIGPQVADFEDGGDASNACT